MLGGIVLLIVVVAVAAFGIGYELGDPGTATALFVGLAIAGGLLSLMLVVNGAPGAGMTLVFGSLPALIAAPAAYAGGARKER